MLLLLIVAALVAAGAYSAYKSKQGNSFYTHTQEEYLQLEDDIEHRRDRFGRLMPETEEQAPFGSWKWFLSSWKWFLSAGERMHRARLEAEEAGAKESKATRASLAALSGSVQGAKGHYIEQNNTPAPTGPAPKKALGDLLSPRDEEAAVPAPSAAAPAPSADASKASASLVGSLSSRMSSARRRASGFVLRSSTTKPVASIAEEAPTAAVEAPTAAPAAAPAHAVTFSAAVAFGGLALPGEAVAEAAPVAIVSAPAAAAPEPTAEASPPAASPPPEPAAALSEATTAKIKELFTKMDENGDGSLTAEESEKHFKKFAKLATKAMFKEVCASCKQNP